MIWWFMMDDDGMHRCVEGWVVKPLERGLWRIKASHAGVGPGERLEESQLKVCFNSRSFLEYTLLIMARRGEWTRAILLVHLLLLLVQSSYSTKQLIRRYRDDECQLVNRRWGGLSSIRRWYPALLGSRALQTITTTTSSQQHAVVPWTRSRLTTTRGGAGPVSKGTGRVSKKTEEEAEATRQRNASLWTIKILFLLFYGSLGSVMPYLPVYYDSLGLPGKKARHLIWHHICDDG